MIRRKARRFEAAMFGYLLTTTCATAYALWRATSFFQAMRKAQFEFAPLLTSDDVSTYPGFVKGVVDTWPQRVAEFPADGPGALRIALFAGLAFAGFALLRDRLRGIDVEQLGAEISVKPATVAKLRALSGYRGPLLRRTDKVLTAAATRHGLYLPEKLFTDLDLRLRKDAVEKVAFAVIHETVHLHSFDNALWSFGAVNALLVAGLLATLTIQPVLYATMIAIPDRTVRAVPYAVSMGLAGLLTIVAMGAVGAMSSGLLASLKAAREYFADAAAAEAIGSAHLPYDGTDDRGRIGNRYEAWRTDITPPDRRLHVQGFFPRTGALAAFAVGVWILVRTGLLIASGLRYGLIGAAFDVVTMLSLCAMMLALPRRGAGIRSYDRLPWLAAAAIPCLVLGTIVQIDGFAERFGLAPFFGTGATIAVLAPAVGALLCFWAWSMIVTRRPDAIPEERDAATPQPALSIPFTFMAASPAWSMSYVVGGLCLFTLSGVVVDALLGSDLSGDARILDIVSAIACCPVLLLIAWNMRRPGPKSTLAEMVLSIPIAALIFYVAMMMASAQTSGTVAGPPADGSALMSRIASFDSSALPSLIVALVFAALLTLSWWARYRLKIWQISDEVKL